MKISLVSSSLQKSSQSSRIREIFNQLILKKDQSIELYNLDLEKEKVPFWSNEKKNKTNFWGDKWTNISKNLSNSDGFVFIIPEYGGMASPSSKNFFLLCGNGELSHKPGLIVSISSGLGGSYPVTEIRSSSYKNTHIVWIPENIIIRKVVDFGTGRKNIPEWLHNRIDYTLSLLIKYAECMKPIKGFINRKDFGNGM